MNKGFTILLAVLGILVVALVAGVLIFKFPSNLLHPTKTSPTPVAKSLDTPDYQNYQKDREADYKALEQLDKLTNECIDLFIKSPIKQVENGDATGTISGSLSYSAGGFPTEMILCALDINKKVRYCTKDYIENKSYEYGRGYEISLPEGSYYVVYVHPKDSIPITVYGKSFVSELYHQELLEPTIVKVDQGSNVKNITPDQNSAYIICGNN